jgi:hypothetical protein
VLYGREQHPRLRIIDNNRSDALQSVEDRPQQFALVGQDSRHCLLDQCLIDTRLRYRRLGVLLADLP